MPYEKVKDDNYVELGGINQKSSPYITSTRESLNILNLDMQEPGSLGIRPGLTSAMGTTIIANSTFAFSSPVIAINQMLVSSNVDTLTQFALIVNGKYAAFYNTLTKQVTSTQRVFPATTHLNFAPNGVNFSNSESTNQYLITGSLFYKARIVSGGETMSIGEFGLATVRASSEFSGYTATGSGGLTGVYEYRLGLMDRYGGFSPQTWTLGPVSDVTGGYTVSLSGQKHITFFGLTYIISQAVDFQQYYAYVLYRNRVPGFTETDFYVRNITPVSYLIPSYNEISDSDTSTSPFDASEVFNEPAPTSQDIGQFDNTTFEAKYCEEFVSRLFILGQRQLIYSDFNIPQSFQPESFIVFGSDSYPTRGLKKLQNTLVIFFQKGIFRLFGDDPLNFNLTKVSSEFGTISHNSIVQYDNKLWFLDEYQIIQFDGSVCTVVSDRIQPILRTMDIQYAIDFAKGFYWQERNEVWFGFPQSAHYEIDLWVVYNSLTDSWSTFKYPPSKTACMLLSGKNYSNPTAYMGLAEPAQSGDVYIAQVNKDEFSDIGAGITCSITTRYHTESTMSVEKQFRRLYIDHNTGATGALSVNFYPNYGSSLAQVFSITLNGDFQERMDYGIPARSVGMEFIHVANGNQFRIYGYSLDVRFQRNV